MAKIIIVEDDLTISDTIKSWLRKEKHSVETTATGREGLDLLLHFKYDLAILDWQLPDIPGIEIAKQIRARDNDMAILMLTSKSELADRITGLDAGAYDYIVKPCSLEELSARIRALLRRPGATQQEESRILAGDLAIDKISREVFVGEQKLKLSRSEFDILAFLAKNHGSSFSSSAIIARLWADKPNASRDVLRVHIRHLREKMQAQNCKASIVTSDLNEYSLDY